VRPEADLDPAAEERPADLVASLLVPCIVVAHRPALVGRAARAAAHIALPVASLGCFHRTREAAMAEFQQIRRLQAIYQTGLFAILALGVANIVVTLETLARM
jgi:hypothetical protein